MKFESITIDRAETEAVQKLALEVDSRKEIISYMLAENADMSSDSVKQYQEEYKKFYLEYQQAKDAVEEKYVKPVVDQLGLEKLNWTLNFRTSVIDLTE